MKARLIGYTQTPSGDFIGVDDLQDFVAYCARVSNPTNQMSSATAEKLIRYLIKHKHWSPLEMVSATMEIETTRDIARQLLRHRSFSFQEFSQRYANPADMGETFVLSEARLQDHKNRQNSIETEDDNLQNEWWNKQMAVIETSKMAYNWAIDNGIAKEQARKVLPEGLTLSRLYANGTLRSWIHYIELRSGNGTQKEHMELARECGKAISKIFPLAEDLIQGE
jgi:thymidylate synthase (FAD)|tara:strand:- start:1001 stop:1672 length:672 start_codon:yes stop_codon:yes gene_type:complete